MTVHKAVHRLHVDIQKLHKAEREQKSDKKDLRHDQREIAKDRKELKQDRRAGDRVHKTKDADVKALKHDVTARSNQLTKLETQRNDVMQRYQDVFDPATGTTTHDPARDLALAAIDQKEASVHSTFDSKIDHERAKVQKDQAKILDLRGQIKGDRKEIAHDKKVIAHDRKELKHDAKAVHNARHKGLHDLQPAEFHMGLKSTNKARHELGLKAVDHVIRPTSAAVEKMLDIARSNLGYHEGAGNSNKFSRDMGRPPEAWCADFVSYLAKHAGLHSVNTASAQGIADQLAAKGRWKGKHNPQPGDAVTFNWSGSGGWADHVGIVEKVFKRDGRTYIQTIEGNSSDGVRRKTYPANDSVINGYGRIA